MQVIVGGIQSVSASGRPFGLYYVLVIDNDGRISADDYIANRFMNIEIEEYQKVLVEKYNAYRLHESVYFNTNEEAQRAVEEYVEPAIVIQRLVNS